MKNEYIALERDMLCKDVGYEYVERGNDCRIAAKNLGKRFGTSGNHGDDRPKGCFIEQGFINFNTNQNDIRHGLISPICKVKNIFNIHMK